MKLIVVESPTKARTLGRFLGKGYGVEATVGHILDLPKSPISVDIEDDFKPDYQVISKQKKTIKKLKDEAKKAEEILIATDPDREGEAIAAHVKEVTSNGKKSSGNKLKRIVFHEITKNAVEEAIKHPREVDEDLVNAQVARRVLDRLVGYKLSPLLWKKVRRGLSAGRVQTVAVRLVVEREREIEAFVPDEYWLIDCLTITSKKAELVISLDKITGKKAKIVNKKQADEIVGDLNKASYLIKDVEKREIRKNPYPPYTTSTLTQAAVNVMGWPSKKTMSVAQRLYEEGLITYHRTDSTNISKYALEDVRKLIAEDFGEKYLPDKPWFYKTKAKVAQEAHEAIRPTDIKNKKPNGGKINKDAERLYSLIWSRFVSSQMSPAVYDETRIIVEAKGDKKYELRASGRIMRFNGWREVMPKKALGEAAELPDVEKGEGLDLVKVTPEQKFTQPPPRYNVASLIKELEKLGIGRPSTYAPTISTIIARQYINKEEGRFMATPVGKAVVDYLTMHFPKVFDYQFTAQMEDDLDEIANGDEKWVDVLRTFWGPFAKKLDKAEEKSDRVKIETESLDKPCPECKEGELVVRIGRFGKFISCSRFPDCKYTDTFTEKIDMECPECGKGQVIIKKTKRGRKFYGCSTYPKCKWASWKDPREKKNNEQQSDQVQETG